MSLITKFLHSVIKNLSDQDFFIFFGGTNDTNFAKQDIQFGSALNQLKLLSEKVNFIYCDVPLRFDRPNLNKNVKLINNNITKIFDLNKSAQCIKLSLLDRKYFTYHGLHMTLRGKRFVGNQILSCVDKIMNSFLDRQLSIKVTK